MQHKRDQSQPGVIGLILAGGRSRRMGGKDKALLELGGRPLLQHVIDRLREQVTELAISSNRPAASYADFGLPVIADRLADYQGPLAGTEAGLVTWPDQPLLTVAVDLPFLPHDLVSRLHEQLQDDRCAYASNGESHSLAILWSPGQASALAATLQNGQRSVHAWLAGHGRKVVFTPSAAEDVGFNINTDEDLAEAERRLAGND